MAKKKTVTPVIDMNYLEECEEYARALAFHEIKQRINDDKLYYSLKHKTFFFKLLKSYGYIWEEEKYIGNHKRKNNTLKYYAKIKNEASPTQLYIDDVVISWEANGRRISDVNEIITFIKENGLDDMCCSLQEKLFQIH